MCHDIDLNIPIRDLLDRLGLRTGAPAQVQMRRVRAHIVEMEDVLFHHNSAVLMPSGGPQGESAADGDEDDAADPEDAEIEARQSAVTGLQTIALVFREFEFIPNLWMVIAGHTDTSGTDQYNFGLSLLRAQNVLYLFENNKRTQWAEVCYGKQKVEDYQQIMKYFAFKHADWNCDPGDLDNDWGPNTRRATENFFAANHLADNLIDQVAGDGAKRWPVAAWEVVYDLYNQEICTALGVSAEELIIQRERLRFVDNTKKCVGCGESFPIDDAEKENYRSNENRRVEIFLFGTDDAPMVMDCPDRDTTKHTTDECPLRNRHHMIPVYIDRTDLTAIAYHLEFIYYNPIKGSFKNVPEGLTIGVFETVGDTSREIRSSTAYTEGLYVIRVQDNPDREGLHFVFETDGTKWIHTPNDAATPSIVTESVETVEGKTWAERLQYYDLPRRWSSKNYWVHNQPNVPAGHRFEAAMRNRHIKPYGDQMTDLDHPLIFSLDDIVLVDGQGRQNISDKNDSGNPMALSADSKLTLFYLDKDDDYSLTIYDPEDDRPYFSGIPFQNNLITRIITAGIPRFLVFAGEFYSIRNKRTERVRGFNNDRDVVGARAAVLNDASDHKFHAIHVNITRDGDGDEGPNYGRRPSADYDYVQTNCGNYELHYLDKCGEFDGKPLSYLVIYWCCRFGAHGNAPTDPNWRANFEEHAMTESMERSNRPYLLTKATGSKDILIRPFHFFEAKLDGRGGKHKAVVRVSRDSGAWMMPEEAKFEQRAYQPIAGYYSGVEAPADGDTVQDVDGAQYTPFTSNHEFGHATGCFDDYMYSLKDGDDTYFGLAGYSQPYTAPGGPYSDDMLARMFHNRSPRMRNIWHFVNWVNDQAGLDLDDFLDSTQFKMKYDYTSGGAARTIELDLRNKVHNARVRHYRDTCNPTFSNSNFVFRAGQAGRGDLLVYKTGGETSHTLDPIHVFDAILVVRSNLQMNFKSGFFRWLAGRGWNTERRRNWLVQFLKLPIAGLNRYYLESSDAANDFHKTLLLFKPFFCLGSPPAGHSSHFEIEVTRDNSRDFETDEHEIECGSNVDPDRILKYIYGKNTAGDLAANDFSRIAEWLGGATVADGNFTVRTR